jgi:hypothetical protein
MEAEGGRGGVKIDIRVVYKIMRPFWILLKWGAL